MSTRTPARPETRVQFRVAYWDGESDPVFLAYDSKTWPGPGTRDRIFRWLEKEFLQQHGKQPNERRTIQHLREDAVTDKELAGLLMEQEHDLTECDKDSECTDGACCVQVLPTDAD